jgi:hypothetical protein
MSPEEKPSEPKKLEKKKHRSPSYPIISISDAIERLRKIYQRDKRAFTTYDAILEHLGYSAKGRSGTSGRVVAALRMYGLLDEKSGQFRVSDSGFRILEYPEDSPERQGLVKEAALKPPVFRKLLEYYSGEIPSDTALRSHLIFNEGFNPDSVGNFIRAFRETLDVANPSPEDYTEAEASDDTSSLPFGGQPMQPTQQFRSAESLNVVPPPVNQTPAPLTRGTRVIIDIPSEGEIKISFTGDVNMKTFQFVNEILKLQNVLFPNNTSSPTETNLQDTQNIKLSDFE